MSDEKRYRPDTEEAYQTPYMNECRDGEYVTYEDYQKLDALFERKHKAYGMAHDQAMSNGSEVIRLRAENEKLRLMINSN